MNNNIHFDAIEAGDDLSITLRGTVAKRRDIDGGVAIDCGGNRHYVYKWEVNAGAVEKVVRHEKLVEFEPGDVVRHKRMSTQEYVILKDRHKMVSLANGEVVNLVNAPTSESFDRVSLDTL